MTKEFSAGKQVALGLLGLVLTVTSVHLDRKDTAMQKDPVAIASRLQSKIGNEDFKLGNTLQLSGRDLLDSKKMQELTAKYKAIYDQMEADKNKYAQLAKNPNVGKTNWANELSTLLYVSTFLLSGASFLRGAQRKGWYRG